MTRAEATRGKLIETAIDLVRRNGYTATSVDDICKAAGITKGAFFHHFPSKEALVAAALQLWEDRMAHVHTTAAFKSIKDPRKRVLSYFNFFLDIFSNPNIVKSCPAGTTVQEVAHSNPTLQSAANTCFMNEVGRFKDLLDSAIQDTSKASRKKIDTTSLAAFWIASLQGALLLFKANQDDILFRKNLLHARDYILAQLPQP